MSYNISMRWSQLLPINRSLFIIDVDLIFILVQALKIVSGRNKNSEFIEKAGNFFILYKTLWINLQVKESLKGILVLSENTVGCSDDTPSVLYPLQKHKRTCIYSGYTRSKSTERAQSVNMQFYNGVLVN